MNLSQLKTIWHGISTIHNVEDEEITINDMSVGMDNYISIETTSENVIVNICVMESEDTNETS